MSNKKAKKRLNAVMRSANSLVNDALRQHQGPVRKSTIYAMRRLAIAIAAK